MIHAYLLVLAASHMVVLLMQHVMQGSFCERVKLVAEITVVIAYVVGYVLFLVHEL